METAVYSPRDATVADVYVKPGTIVSARDLLVVLKGERADVAWAFSPCLKP
jgi:pyruvate carboxylase